MRHLLIVDVDDTLFDWLTMWSKSFSWLITEVERACRKTQPEVRTIFKRLHQAARTSERGLHLDDCTNFGLTEQQLDAILIGYSSLIAQHTILFDSVRDVFRELHCRGVKLVAHTDTAPCIAEERLAMLGLDGMVSHLFTSPGHGVTVHRRSTMRLKTTGVTELLVRKPDPSAVEAILHAFGVPPGETVYLGDSVKKDLPMARAAGVLDVFASYGCRRDSTDYSDLLVSVTHWTQEEVDHERALRKVDPERSIQEFSGILEYF